MAKIGRVCPTAFHPEGRIARPTQHATGLRPSVLGQDARKAEDASWESKSASHSAQITANAEQAKPTAQDPTAQV